MFADAVTMGVLLLGASPVPSARLGRVPLMVPGAIINAALV